MLPQLIVPSGDVPSKQSITPRPPKTNSELNSVYKLDTSMKSPQQPSESHRIDRLFQKMKLEERSAIIDRIHKLRLEAFDSKVEVCKPIMPVVREKDRLIEQYF